MDSERRLDIADAPAHARNSGPQNQRKPRGEFRPARDCAGTIKLRSLAVHASAKNHGVYGHEAKKYQLGPKKGVVIILFRLATEQQNSAGGYEQKAVTLGNAQLIDNIGDGSTGHGPAEKTEVG